MDLFILKSWLEARFRYNERGASMTEYAILVALIAIAALAATRLLGGKVQSSFSTSASGFAP